MISTEHVKAHSRDEKEVNRADIRSANPTAICQSTALAGATKQAASTNAAPDVSV